MSAALRFRNFLFVRFSHFIVRLIYKTSKITIYGNFNLLDDGNEYLIVFWHGDSCIYYPLFRDKNICVLTTTTMRGDNISGIIRLFGYVPIQAPDEDDGKNHILRIRGESRGKHLGVTLDGPAGPHHVPKRFVILLSRVCKKPMMPIAVRVKRKLIINSRWDKYMIPLPFSRIDFYVGDPIDAKLHKNADEQVVEFMSNPENYRISV